MASALPHAFRPGLCQRAPSCRIRVRLSGPLSCAVALCDALRNAAFNPAPTEVFGIRALLVDQLAAGDQRSCAVDHVKQFGFRFRERKPPGS